MITSNLNLRVIPRILCSKLLLKYIRVLLNNNLSKKKQKKKKTKEKKEKKTPAVKFLELIFRNNIILRHISKHLSRSKALRNISANFSKLIPHQRCCRFLLFEHLSKAQINQVQDVSQKVMLHRPNSITKAMLLFFQISWKSCLIRPCV